MRRPLPMPCVALVTDRRVIGGVERLEWAVEAALAGGVNVVQIREKDMAAGALLELAERLRSITEGRALLFVNDRLDVAMACHADGVQLGEESLPVAHARRAVGTREALIGRSVHDVEGARAAADAGADLLLVGMVYGSASHPGQRPGGTALVREVTASVSAPVLGIGGVTVANAPAVIEAGASGVAVVREVLAAPSPYRAAQRLREAVKGAYAALCDSRQVGAV